MINQFYKKLLLGLITALVVTCAVVFTLPDAKVAQAEQDWPSQTYLVKIFPEYLEFLKLVGQNVEPVFGSSLGTGLTNYYTFESHLSLTDLNPMLSGKIEYLEIDKEIHTELEVLKRAPNDPGYSNSSSNVDKQWGLVKTNFSKAWKKTLGSSEVVIAVIDTGVDASHEDFEDTNFVKGYNVITDTEILRSRNSDDNGHGTLVAGIIAATTNNKTGIAGASPLTSIMPVKALNTRGSGSISKISKGIVWAADNGADIINMSLGGLGFAHNTTLANAISYAYDKGVVIVAAAGNDVAITGGNLDDAPVFPVCNDNGKNMIIGVTASDSKDIKPNFANFGKACVDVTAPGKRILSLINHDPATGLSSPDSYAYASGTSMAAPFVSAQAALLKSLYPEATNGQIRDRIMATADPIDRLNINHCAGFPCKGYLGSGRINVPKSLGSSQNTIINGDVVLVRNTELWYYINGGRKQLITPFVKSQRFSNTKTKKVNLADLELFPEGSYAEPLDGTLVKSNIDSAVYYISNGVRLPVNARVFGMRGFSFANVVELPFTDINSWVLGSWLTPPDGTLLKTKSNPTIYWVSEGSLHAVSSEFYRQKGLNIFPVLIISDGELQQYPVGESL